jgi:hypothetical protein
MNKFLLLTLLGLVTICRVSFGAETPSKTNSSNQSVVEVKCQILTVPVKVLKETGLDWIGKGSFPPGVYALAGVFTKNQMDVLWKGLLGQPGVLIEEVGDVTVKSGESGKTQHGYDFSYPVDYDASAKPTNRATVFLGTKLEVKPVVSDIQIDLYLNLEKKFLEGLSQIYSIKETDLLTKPTFDELVATLPKHHVFEPVIRNQSCESNVTVYTGQSIFFSMDDYENADLWGKIPPQNMRLKDPSKRRFLIITATVIEPETAKH